MTRAASRLAVARRIALTAALGVVAALAPAQARERAAPAGKGFQFAVIGHPFKQGADEAPLKRAIAAAMQGNPAFIVATGIKGDKEPCSDKLYAARHAILDDAAAPVVVSLAGSDWSACLNSAGRSNAIERLNRLRELFYGEPESLGAQRIALSRLSSTAKFRSYAENAHWEYGKVLFATINLPANNNHYRPEAGRNSEYEDRLVANRAWLHRLFTLAARQKLQGLVLFSDGAIGLQEEEGFSLLPRFESKQDGFAEPRRQINTLAKKFKGKVLLVDTQIQTQVGAAGRTETAIDWRGNVGHLSVAAESAEVRVNPDAATLFTIKGGGAETTP
ncbi:hypothetical protein SAMN05428959_1011322 [Duganella sp. CF517]|uniref:hypothetical protein n=1 Tax=Duganella sp. CF517 TaxID=1881038 RepID=UPI0008D05602|nr:hypothetical protein [Duganella sp. CF517]SEN35365.1 hypothetical protein SAMN05428959_1011322 [Duganella sp. CF517]